VELDDDGDIRLMAISWTTRISWYQNVSILDFVAVKNNGGGVMFCQAASCQSRMHILFILRKTT